MPAILLPDARIVLFALLVSGLAGYGLRVGRRPGFTRTGLVRGIRPESLLCRWRLRKIERAGRGPGCTLVCWCLGPSCSLRRMHNSSLLSGLTGSSHLGACALDPAKGFYERQARVFFGTSSLINFRCRQPGVEAGQSRKSLFSCGCPGRRN